MSVEDLVYSVGTKVLVNIQDTQGSDDPVEDRAHDGQIATIKERVYTAQKDGYKVEFKDGYETYVYPYEVKAD